jgi:hypothetical protein
MIGRIESLRRRVRSVPTRIHDMSAEFKKEIQLEIVHLLFIDIVGYSKLSINENAPRSIIQSIRLASDSRSIGH